MKMKFFITHLAWKKIPWGGRGRSEEWLKQTLKAPIATTAMLQFVTELKNFGLDFVMRPLHIKSNKAS